MQLVETLIKQLYTHNYVVIPQLGGFITRVQGARFSKSKHLIFPPRKEIIFNPKLHQDDGLLVDAIVKEQKLKYVEAEKLLQAEIESWKTLLNSGKSLALNKIGILSLNEKGILKFEQNPHSNFLVDSFGLEYAQIQKLKKIKKHALYETSPIPKQTETIIIEKLPVSYKRFQTLSVAAIALLTISASYLYLLSFQPKMVEEAGLNFFNIPFADTMQTSKIQETEIEKKSIDKISPDTDSETTQAQESNKDNEENEPIINQIEAEPTSTVDESNSKKEIDVVESNLNSKLLFYVIVSSLNSADKIDVEVNRFKQKGYEPIIIPDKDGKFRISVGSFASRDSAETFRQNILNDNRISGWILKK